MDAKLSIRPIVVTLLASIALVLLVGWWCVRMEYLVWPLDTNALVVGAIGSAIASMLISIVYTVVSEQGIVRYAAGAASQRAVDEVLKLVAMVPEAVYEGASKPNRRFEDRFSADFKQSRDYFFFSATASYCSTRLGALASEGLLQDKRVRVFILDPRDEQLLAAQARKRLQLNSAVPQSTAAEIDREASRLKKEIFQTLARLYPLVHVFDIDVRFHRSFVFFRSEIFEGGMFLSFLRGNDDFPGSVYYRRTSPVYEAFYRHHKHHQELPPEFSLMDQKDSTLEQILKQLGCPFTVNELCTASA
ncbi:MAG TPA: hypothetical protein VJV23_12305 [Candidatus Polarisedimenticolia bacterium]|nr:hypothetical protein [Candidatus Polarisedimenticolia bacterium]